MPRPREGRPIPESRLRICREGRWTSIDTSTLCAGRTVVLFSLPEHPSRLPGYLWRYEELAAVLQENGVDEVVALSADAGPELAAWGRQQGLRRLSYASEAESGLSAALGLAQAGGAPRRYSLLARDGRIRHLLVEPDDAALTVSDADSMLWHLNPRAHGPELVGLFTRPGCPRCARARQLLEERGLDYTELSVGAQVNERALRAFTAADEVPQIFISGSLIGGTEALEEWLQGGPEPATVEALANPAP